LENPDCLLFVTEEKRGLIMKILFLMFAIAFLASNKINQFFSGSSQKEEPEPQKSSHRDFRIGVLPSEF